MHINLRTIFVVFATVAVYLAAPVIFLRGNPKSVIAQSAQMVLLMPLVVIWTMAALWAVNHRGRLVGADLVIWAMGLNIGGRFATESLKSLGYRISNNSSHDVVASVFMLSAVSSALVTTASWTLVLLAFARANRGRLESTLIQPVDSEEAASPWNDRGDS